MPRDRKDRIKEDDIVRVTAGPNAGLEGRVLIVHRATPYYERRVFLEFALFDGPHRTYVPMRWLERVVR